MKLSIYVCCHFILTLYAQFLRVKCARVFINILRFYVLFFFFCSHFSAYSCICAFYSFCLVFYYVFTLLLFFLFTSFSSFCTYKFIVVLYVCLQDIGYCSLIHPLQNCFHRKIIVRLFFTLLSFGLFLDCFVAARKWQNEECKTRIFIVSERWQQMWNSNSNTKTKTERIYAISDSIFPLHLAKFITTFIWKLLLDSSIHSFTNRKGTCTHRV